MRVIPSRFLITLSLLIASLLLLRAEAHSQSAPNFALKLNSYRSSPQGPVSTVTWLYSDDGIFSFSSNVSHQGLSGEQFVTVGESLGFAIYVRSQPDFFPNGGPVKRDRTFTGTVSASKPFGGNFSARSTAPASYPSLGSGCDSYNGPTHWTACARFEAPKTETNEVFYVDSVTSNAGFPATNSVPDYPLVPYRQVSGGTSLLSEITFFCDPRYGLNTCTIPAVGGSNSLTGTLAVTISPPTYTMQPGNNPGHQDHFTCGAQNAESQPGGASGPGLGAFGFDGEGKPPMSIALNASTGNGLVTVEDPVRTRGYPLLNRIHLNTQVVESQRPMANATFTYDIHMYSPAMPGQSRWLVVDGDGKRLDYGTGASPLGAPGNYAILTQTPTGYLLSNAGAPENLRSTGNFSYTFDTDGKLLSITDPAGNVQTLTYTSGQLTSVLDVSSNKQLTFVWTGNRITSTTENGGAQTVLTYTSGGARLATIAAQDSAFGVARTAQFTYNSGGLLETVTRDSDPTNTYTFSYVTLTPNVPLARIFGEGRSVQPFYGSYVPASTAYARVIVPNQKGGLAIYDMNSNFDVIKATYPSVAGASTGSSITYGYDVNRNLTSWSDGSTSETYQYETNGLLKKIIRADSTFVQYNWSGADLQSIADSLGMLATISYGNSALAHVPTAITDASSNVWTLARNGFGQITDITPPLSAPSGARTFTYDETPSSSSYGWLKKITDALGNEIRFDSFSTEGEATSISSDPDPSTPSTRITETAAYDAAGRLRTLTHADGKGIVFSYSGRNLSYVDDEAATRTTFTYCQNCDAVQTVNTPLGHTLRWNVDQDLNQTSFTDARLNSTQYVYGLAQELTGVNYPDGSVLSYLYDSALRVRKVTNARAQESNYTYDTLGRLSQISFPTTGNTSNTFSYRNDDSLLSFTDAAGTTTREYYANRLLKAEVYNYALSGLTPVQRVEYEYYSDGSLKKITWKNGTTVVGTWVYSYDAAGRMQSVVSFGETDTFTYDGEGKLLRQNNHNNTSINYAWNDERKWPTSITHKQASTPFASYVLEYDGNLNTVGNLTKSTELSGEVMSYGYDALYRLTSESRTGSDAYSLAYGYDLAGNLNTVNSSTFGTYDAANKISTLNGGTISHDADGDITAVTHPSISSSSLSWDTRGKLYSLNAGTTTIGYLYDALGRRVMQSQGTTKRFYIFAGDKLLGEMQGGSPKVAYTWGPDGLVSERLFGVMYINFVQAVPSVPESQTQISQAQDETGLSGYATEVSTDSVEMPIPTGDITLWYHYGPQGETKYLTDISGSITDTYSYDAYGIPLSSTETFYNAHRYGGKYGYHSNLNPTGLVLAGARWYSPQLRRWVSRDPIEYRGGENLYAYVGGRPVGWVDPSGLWPFLYNGSNRKIRIKPESNDATPRSYCMPGEFCNIDGVFKDGCPLPYKIPSNCLFSYVNPKGEVATYACFLQEIFGMPHVMTPSEFSINPNWK